MCSIEPDLIGVHAAVRQYANGQGTSKPSTSDPIRELIDECCHNFAKTIRKESVYDMRDLIRLTRPGVA